MSDNVYTFKYTAPAPSKKCMICGEEITDEEFEYEDYFTVFAGHSEEAFAGYVCFHCVKKT